MFVIKNMFISGATVLYSWLKYLKDIQNIKKTMHTITHIQIVEDWFFFYYFKIHSKYDPISLLFQVSTGMIDWL